MSWEHFSYSDFSSGLTLIDGENGRGKSSIWDGPSYALFGETVRGDKNDLVVNRAFKKDCHVRYVFTVRGDTYDVNRYRKHTGRCENKMTLKNRLIIKFTPKGGKEKLIEKSSVADTQKWLMSKIGITKELYGCTVVHAQGSMFNFVNETDKGQKEILGLIKNVDFTKALKKTREAIAKAKTKASETDAKCCSLQRRLESNSLESLKEKKDSFKKDIESDIEEILKRVEKFSKDIEDLEQGYEEAPKPIDNKDESLAIKNEIKTFGSKLAKVEIKYSTLAKRIKESDVEIECPTCHRPYDEAHESPNTDEMEASLNKLKLLKRKYTKKIDALEEKKGLLESEERKRSAKIMAVLNSNKHIEYTVEANRSKIQNCNDNIKALKTRKNPYLELIKEEKQKLKETKQEIKELDKLLSKYEDIITYLVFWEKAFSDNGVKSFIFDSIVSGLTDKANNNLNILSDGELAIEFTAQTKLKDGSLREKFDCLIHIDDYTVPFSSYSGGEKTRISIAVDLALESLMCEHYGTEFNFLVMDEQDIYMDDKGRASYMRMLRKISQDKRVFVVSHDAELKSEFDNVIRVERSATGKSKAKEA